MGSNTIKLALLASVFAGAFSMPASAAIIYDSTITRLGTGFGSVPRMLTVEVTGSDKTTNPANNIESACDGNTGGALAIGQCSGILGSNGYAVANSADSVSGGKDALV